MGVRKCKPGDKQLTRFRDLFLRGLLLRIWKLRRHTSIPTQQFALDQLTCELDARKVRGQESPREKGSQRARQRKGRRGRGYVLAA